MRPAPSRAETILDALALIDVTLVGNLILIVVFSGYENFVSRIDTTGNPTWPIWITKIDFAGLKQKLLACIVAISAIHVLEAFLNIDASFDATRMTWLVARASGVRDLDAAARAVGSLDAGQGRVATATPSLRAIRHRDLPRALEFLCRPVEHEQRALGDAEIGAVQLQLAALDPVADERERHQVLERAEHRGLLDADDEFLHRLMRALLDDFARLDEHRHPFADEVARRQRLDLVDEGADAAALGVAEDHDVFHAQHR